MNTPLYLQLHVVLCNAQLNHHANVTVLNILGVGVPTVLPNTAAPNRVCYRKSSSSKFALVEEVNSFSRIE